jgi:hypothetical protein
LVISLGLLLATRTRDLLRLLLLLDARALLLAQQDTLDRGKGVIVALDLDGALGPAARRSPAFAPVRGPWPMLTEAVVSGQLGLALQLVLLAAGVEVLVEGEHPEAGGYCTRTLARRLPLWCIARLPDFGLSPAPAFRRLDARRRGSRLVRDGEPGMSGDGIRRTRRCLTFIAASSATLGRLTEGGRVTRVKWLARVL